MDIQGALTESRGVAGLKCLGDILAKPARITLDENEEHRKTSLG